MVERFHVGQRVRLKKKKTLATEPPVLFPRGATGTVMVVDGVGEIEGKIAVWVRMDQHFPQLARWDNALLVKCSDITDEARGRLRRAWDGWRGR
jgi:hypothetical protein